MRVFNELNKPNRQTVRGKELARKARLKARAARKTANKLFNADANAKDRELQAKYDRLKEKGILVA